MSNNIFARTSSQNRSHTSRVKSRPAETAETAGSLAMNNQRSYLAMNSYDLFTPSSPYSLNIDFSNYANYNYSGNYNSASSSNGGFWNSFANAIAVVGTDCTGGFAGGGASVSSGASCGGGGGGFTSFV